MWEIIKSDLETEPLQVSGQGSSIFWHGASHFLIPVPPKIVDSLSSSDMVQTEGSNVTLECLASGSPEPEVVWRREDAREITVDKNNTGEWHELSLKPVFSDFSVNPVHIGLGFGIALELGFSLSGLDLGLGLDN